MVKEFEKEPVSSKKRKNSDRSRSSSKDCYEKQKKRRSRSRSSLSDSRSRSGSRRHRHCKEDRYSPRKSRVLGVFGLSSQTLAEDLIVEFSRYGAIYDIKIVYDVKTNNSRGFGFIYFDHVNDAAKARRACNGMRLHNKRIRVDYSITKRPHSPTPGRYMGLRNDDLSYSRSSSSSYRRYRRRSTHSRSR